MVFQPVELIYYKYNSLHFVKYGVLLYDDATVLSQPLEQRQEFRGPTGFSSRVVHLELVAVIYEHGEGQRGVQIMHQFVGQGLGLVRMREANVLVFNQLLNEELASRDSLGVRELTAFHHRRKRVHNNVKGGT